MTIYKSLADITSAANAGTLEWGESGNQHAGFWGWYIFGDPRNAQDQADRSSTSVQKILNIIKLTQPNSDATKNIAKLLGEKAFPDPGQAPPGDLQGNIGNPLGSVTDFLNVLTQPQLWIRIAEVLIGALLLGVGLASVTGTANVVSKLVKSKVPL